MRTVRNSYFSSRRVQLQAASLPAADSLYELRVKREPKEIAPYERHRCSCYRLPKKRLAAQPKSIEIKWKLLRALLRAAIYTSAIVDQGT